MVKSLITKLNGVCSNSSLRKLGKITLKVLPVASPNSETQRITLQFNEKSTLVATEGFFHDGANLNLGTTKTLEAGVEEQIYVSNGAIIEIPKYSIVKIITEAKVALDLEQFDFCPALETFKINSTKLTGDFEALCKSTKLTSVSLILTAVKSDISVFSKFTSLKYLDLNTSVEIHGNIAALSRLTELTTLNLNGCKVSGDISALSGLSKLKTIYIGLLNTGDLSSLPKNVTYAAASGNFKQFEWKKERPSNYPIISLETIGCSNIDSMLKNLAKCQVPSESVKKIISVFGDNRTNDSDAAISTLRGMGYTISIT